VVILLLQVEQVPHLVEQLGAPGAVSGPWSLTAELADARLELKGQLRFLAQEGDQLASGSARLQAGGHVPGQADGVQAGSEKRLPEGTGKLGTRIFHIHCVAHSIL